MSEENEQPLEEQIVEQVRDWFRRAALATRDRLIECSTIEITLTNPAGDEDGTLYLQAEFRTTTPYSCEGRVEGVSFEPYSGTTKVGAL